MPRYPVDKRIVLPGHIPFGQPDPNSRWKRHAGDDSANGTGTPVYAPASGTVTSYTGDQYQGKVVEIFDGTYYPHVFHLRDRSVSPGQPVAEGQLIGYSGSTGLSSGPHIHFGVGKKSLPNIKVFSEFIDPMEYIKQGGTVVAGVSIVGNVVSASWGPGRLDLFAKGSDGGLYHCYFNEKGWQLKDNWERLPGGVIDVGSASSPGEGQLHIFGTGNGGHCYHWWLQPDGKWGLEDLGIIKKG